MLNVNPHQPKPVMYWNEDAILKKSGLNDEDTFFDQIS